ncbi:hypothetical protein EMIHUDRAFT_465087, partial [Emiliania huxleyi CCMP1516]|uniref:Uncharacterized protein n=2 Tax=Emiliania huxleyi TaxID=2903 RepID=A0A0D3IJH5_EMIH1
AWRLLNRQAHRAQHPAGAASGFKSSCGNGAESSGKARGSRRGARSRSACAVGTAGWAAGGRVTSGCARESVGLRRCALLGGAAGGGAAEAGRHRRPLPPPPLLVGRQGQGGATPLDVAQRDAARPERAAKRTDRRGRGRRRGRATRRRRRRRSGGAQRRRPAREAVAARAGERRGVGPRGAPLAALVGQRLLDDAAARERRHLFAPRHVALPHARPTPAAPLCAEAAALLRGRPGLAPARGGGRPGRELPAQAPQALLDPRVALHVALPDGAADARQDLLGAGALHGDEAVPPRARHPWRPRLLERAAHRRALRLPARHARRGRQHAHAAGRHAVRPVQGVPVAARLRLHHPQPAAQRARRRDPRGAARRVRRLCRRGVRRRGRRDARRRQADRVALLWHRAAPPEPEPPARVPRDVQGAPLVATAVGPGAAARRGSA